MKFVPFFLVLMAVLVGGGILAADSLAESAIESSGTSALGVETRLEEASVGLFSGELRLAGLEVDNPGGFSDEPLLRFESGRLQVGIKSLMADRVHAPSLELDGIRLVLEEKGTRRNYGEVLKSLEKVARTRDQDKKAERDGGKLFVIDRLVLRNVEVALRLDVGTAESSAHVRIPQIVLDDLGSRSFSLEELTSLVVRTLLEHGGAKAVGAIPEELLHDLQDRLADVVDVEFEGLEELRVKALDRIYRK